MQFTTTCAFANYSELNCEARCTANADVASNLDRCAFSFPPDGGMAACLQTQQCIAATNPPASTCATLCSAASLVCTTIDPANCQASCGSSPAAQTVYRNCVMFNPICTSLQNCLAQGLATLDAGTGGGGGSTGGGGGTTGGGGGATGGGGGAVDAGTISEVANLMCSNLMDPRVTWTSSETTFMVLNRQSGFPGTSCHDTGSYGTTTHQTLPVCSGFGELHIVWICAVGADGGFSTGKKMNVTCPATAGANGSCMVVP